MPKFKKEKGSNKVNRKGLDEDFAYKTVLKSIVLAGLFLVISILFNMEIVTFFMDKGGFWVIIDVVIKVIVILLFFFFIIISIGNYQELVGRPLKSKLIILIFVLSLLQAFRNPLVFVFTFFGLTAITVYIFFVQES